MAGRLGGGALGSAIEDSMFGDPNDPNDKKPPERVWYHYTDEAGYKSISASGNITPGASGRVYATPLPLSTDEAQARIFINAPGYEGKGAYVIQFTTKQGVELLPGKPGEFYYPGSLRNGRTIDIKSAGPNSFR